MAKFNQGGQWSLTGDEDTLLFKTGEKRQAGKNEVIERRKVDPNSEEAKKLFEALAKAIVKDTPKQPTNEELFGHLVVPEEKLQKAEEEWQNKIGDFYKEAAKPLEKQDSRENLDWGNGGSFNDSLTPEELAERNKHIG
jgi:hypothetical protein